MTRLRLLVINEFKLARTALPVHAVAILQPLVLFLLMTMILPKPTFDMRVLTPRTAAARDLTAAMREVGSPIGDRYINLITFAPPARMNTQQVITVEADGGVTRATQRFGLIDSNRLKNYRNRLTAAALLMWDASLGTRAVTVDQYPQLPRDVPYPVYFGLAMLAFTAFFAAAVIGAILMAQDLELATVTEYRLAPVPATMVLGARLTRLTLSGLLAAGLLLLVEGLVTGYWPASLLRAGLILLPMAIAGGCVGVLAGMVARRSLPAFQIALVVSLLAWLLGGALDLAATFGGWYEIASRFTPHAHAVELLFANQYGTATGTPAASALVLVLLAFVGPAITVLAYQRLVLRQE